MMKKISFIVPCYNEEPALPEFFRVITDLARSLETYDFEFLFIDDGSTDRSLETLIDFAKSDSRAVVAQFSRNFGKESALTAGLDLATGDAVIPIDADLQDPPELIREMVQLWEEGALVVVAKRTERSSDSFLKRATARLFYRLQNTIGDITIVEDAGDFRLMDRVVVDALKQLPERNRFMKGLFTWPGFQQAEVTYERPKRQQGKTKFNYWKLWNFALDGVTSFSTVPLRIWTYLGLAAGAIAFIYAVLLIARTIVFGIDVPGYASLMVVVLFLGSLQLVSLGVIGEYLGRTYHEVKRRPLYLVSKLHSFKPAAGSRAKPKPTRKAAR